MRIYTRINTTHPVFHEVACALRWLGLRDRLCCPDCHAVGTYKPHGGLWDRLVLKDRPVRRWLCKWCGLYVGPEEVRKAFIDGKLRVWSLLKEMDELGTRDFTLSPPQEAIEDYYNFEVDPWAG